MDLTIPATFRSKLRRMIMMATLCVCLPSCTSSWTRSYNRWEALSATPTFSNWAQCITDRSHDWLVPGSKFQRPAEMTSAGPNSEPKIFVWILNACKDQMSAREWGRLPEEKVRQLIGDAYSHFKQLEIRIRGQLDDSII